MKRPPNHIVGKQRQAQREFARGLRRHPTEAEYRLWGHLRCRQLDGFKFRRQAPLGSYVVDFVCFEVKLVIELDGSQHALRKEYDERRTKFLNARGFRVIRFANDEIAEDLDGVLERIVNELHTLSREQSAEDPQDAR